MYISVSDAATKFNISKRRVQLLCEQGRISGANMVSGVWLIPETALNLYNFIMVLWLQGVQH